MASITAQINALALAMANQINLVRADMGVLADLQTPAKNTLVAAINSAFNSGGGGEGGVMIDDSVVASNKVWSSEKTNATIASSIATALQGLPAYALIDDGSNADDSTWSSNKIAAMIGAAVADMALIDDSTPTADAVFSSLHTSNLLSGKENAFDAGTTNQWLRGDKTFQVLTKANVGLPNVDNTSDANKPVSTAQAAADAAVLASAQAYANSVVTGLWDDRGGYDASVNTFPASGGSGTAGAILKSDIWTITVAGTLGGTAVTTNQTVRALEDNPGQTAAKWAISVSGMANVEDQIVDGVIGKAPSQNAVFDALALKEGVIAAGTASQYWKGNKTWGDLATDVRAVVLTGLSTANGAVIAATDSLLTMAGKLQRQITDLSDSLANYVTPGGAQTLSNKTLTTPVLNGFTEGGATGTGAAFTPDMDALSDFEYTTNGNMTITLNLPAVGKSATITVIRGGAHSLTFAAGTGTPTLKYEANYGTPSSVAGDIETYVVKRMRGQNTLLIAKGGKF